MWDARMGHEGLMGGGEAYWVWAEPNGLWPKGGSGLCSHAPLTLSLVQYLLLVEGSRMGRGGAYGVWVEPSWGRGQKVGVANVSPAPWNGPWW